MTSAARIHSATFHAGGPISGGRGAHRVSATLAELVGDRYVIAEIERADGRFTLILDPVWIEFAAGLVDSGQGLVDAADLPRSMLLAVVAGWGADWVEAASIDVHHADDGVPHLRVIGLSCRTA